MIPELILESYVSVHEEKGKEAWKAEGICAKAPSAQCCSENSSWYGLSIVEVCLPTEGMVRDKAKKVRLSTYLTNMLALNMESIQENGNFPLL